MRKAASTSGTQLEKIDFLSDPDKKEDGVPWGRTLQTFGKSRLHCSRGWFCVLSRKVDSTTFLDRTWANPRLTDNVACRSFNPNPRPLPGYVIRAGDILEPPRFYLGEARFFNVFLLLWVLEILIQGIRQRLALPLIPVLFPDSWGYLKQALAASINVPVAGMNGRGFAYSFFLAWVLKIGGTMEGIVVAQHLLSLGSAACWLGSLWLWVRCLPEGLTKALATDPRDCLFRAVVLESTDGSLRETGIGRGHSSADRDAANFARACISPRVEA